VKIVMYTPIAKFVPIIVGYYQDSPVGYGLDGERISVRSPVGTRDVL
jgi:hypothetical protein